MDNKDLKDFDTKENEILKSHSPTAMPIRREKDSLDDFEHLGMDTSPLQEAIKGGVTGVSSAARDLLGEIDKGLESSEKLASKVAEDIFDPFKKEERSIDTHPSAGAGMDSNLLDMGDTKIGDVQNSEDKFDKFLSDLTSFAPPVPSHDVSPFQEETKAAFDGIKSATNDFMDAEREVPFKLSSNNDIINSYKYNDAEPEDTSKKIDTFVTSHTPIFKDTFEDFISTSEPKEPQEPELPIQRSTFEKHPSPVREIKKPATPPPSEPVIPPPKPAKIVSELPQEILLPEPKKEEKKPPKPIIEAAPTPTKPDITDAEAMFKKMGLVESLIYWRDPKKSGPVFGGVLVVLLALTYLSLISVVAYVSLLVLTSTILFRIYKNIVHAVQKTGDGHPFKEYLEIDVSLPQEKVKEIVEIAVAHVNAAIVELRRLFLVEDLVDSIKFAVLLWCFTYLGAWFNGMTLVILAWVALFTLPKVYETNKTQIDANLDLVRSKVAEITSKVKAAIPIGKKPEEKKEQ